MYYLLLGTYYAVSFKNDRAPKILITILSLQKMWSPVACTPKYFATFFNALASVLLLSLFSSLLFFFACFSFSLLLYNIGKLQSHGHKQSPPLRSILETRTGRALPRRLLHASDSHHDGAEHPTPSGFYPFALSRQRARDGADGTCLKGTLFPPRPAGGGNGLSQPHRWAIPAINPTLDSGHLSFSVSTPVV